MAPLCPVRGSPTRKEPSKSVTTYAARYEGGQVGSAVGVGLRAEAVSTPPASVLALEIAIEVSICTVLQPIRNYCVPILMNCRTLKQTNPLSKSEQVEFVKVDPIGICLIVLGWVMIVVVAIAWWTGEFKKGHRSSRLHHGDEDFADL